MKFESKKVKFSKYRVPNKIEIKKIIKLGFIYRLLSFLREEETSGGWAVPTSEQFDYVWFCASYINEN